MNSQALIDGEQAKRALLAGREIRRGLDGWEQLRVVDRIDVPVCDDRGYPLASTFLSQSVSGPQGSAIRNPSSVAKVSAGVS